MDAGRAVLHWECLLSTKVPVAPALPFVLSCLLGQVLCMRRKSPHFKPGWRMQGGGFDSEERGVGGGVYGVEVFYPHCFCFVFVNGKCTVTP